MAEVNAGMLPRFWGEGKRQLDETNRTGALFSGFNSRNTSC
jgi:hypothetical protein